MNNIAVFEDNVGLRLVQLTVQLREKKHFCIYKHFSKFSSGAAQWNSALFENDYISA
jgi:hypothetical protein